MNRSNIFRVVEKSWPWLALVAFAAYPYLPHTNPVLGNQFFPLFIYAILALGLNVVVGNCGLLHLGIAAFFGIGAYITGIVTVYTFPFHVSFLTALVLSFFGAAFMAVIMSAPTLRLRGDYFALVTLGFGQIVIYAIRNLEAITDGTQGLTPLAPPLFPSWFGLSDLWPRWRSYPNYYFICLSLLFLVMFALRNLERSKLGRAWVALREDELASSCMGLNPARLKLSAIALGAGLAGMAGCMYAIGLRSTAGPQAYDFNRSVFTLSCVILGGLSNRSGVILGVLILIGYDSIVTPELDSLLQQNVQGIQNAISRIGVDLDARYLKLSSWKLFIFGLALILIMRFRPEGLLPARRHTNAPPLKGA